MSALSRVAVAVRLFAVLAAFGVAWAQDDESSAGIPGVVVDSTGVGIPHASVLVVPAGESLAVGPRGEFMLPPSSEARLLSARAPGLCTAFDLLVEPGAAPSDGLTLELYREVDFQITVVDEGGLPVANARCSLSLRAGDAHVLTLDPQIHRVERELGAAPRTNAAGRATLLMPAYPSWLWVYADGLSTWSGPVDPSVPLTVVLQGQRVISGVVMDALMQPVGSTVNAPGLSPVWSKEPGPFTVRVERTLSPVRLGFEAAGFCGVRLVDVSAGDVKDLVVRLEPTAKLCGRVVNERGEPYPAYVDLAYVRTDEREWGLLPQGFMNWRITCTGDAGAFELVVPGPGEYLVLIDGMNGPAGKQVAMRAGDPEQLITVSADDRDNIELEITARDATSAAQVALTRVEVTDPHGFQELQRAPALHRYGNGLAHLILGPARLRVAAPGYLVHEQDIELVLGGVPRIDIALTPARRVWFRLIDANRQPLPSTRVIVRDELARPIQLLTSTEAIGDGFTTDHRGEACIDGLPTGPVTLIVEPSSGWATDGPSPTSAALEGRLPAGLSGHIDIALLRRASDGPAGERR